MIYIVIASDMLCIIALTVFPFVFFTPAPPDLSPLRHKIETAASVDNLRASALHILDAREAAANAVAHLHSAIRHLMLLTIALTLVHLYDLLLHFAQVGAINQLRWCSSEFAKLVE